MNFSSVVRFYQCSHSGTDCSSVSSLQGPKSFQQTCSRLGTFLHGNRCPVRACSSTRTSFRHIYLQNGAIHGLQVHICSTMDLQELQNNLPHQGLHQRLQQNPASLSSSSLTLVSSEIFVSHIQNSSFLMLYSRFSLSYQYVIPEVTDVLSLGQWQVLLGASCH